MPIAKKKREICRHVDSHAHPLHRSGEEQQRLVKFIESSSQRETTLLSSLNQSTQATQATLTQHGVSTGFHARSLCCLNAVSVIRGPSSTHSHNRKRERSMHSSEPSIHAPAGFFGSDCERAMDISDSTHPKGNTHTQVPNARYNVQNEFSECRCECR